MSTYYNYAERNAESYVNWGQIGKDVSKMLTDENDIREKKKKEIDDQSREFAKTLSEAPQGQYQDGNALINNFAADMQQTRLMDDRLLKSGQLKLKDYTLRRQNNLDGTTTLVDLQKVYQSTKKTMMDGITNGTLQALVGWNMQQMEAYQDFSNSKAVIDPATGIVNLGKTKLNDQGLRVLTNEVIPVNVMRNLMTTPIETFKVNETLDAVKKGLGSRIQTMQELASLTKTGSLTKLTGIGALEQFSGTEEGKKYQGVVDNWNSAIDDQMSSLLAANKYNLTSILTQNTGKYGSNSFTYDKKLAASDPTKILMIQNPSSSLPEMDPNAPHYKEQYEEAKGWMKDQLLSKIDLEVSKTVTPQTQQLRPKTDAEDVDERDQGVSALQALQDFYTARTPEQLSSAHEKLIATPLAQKFGLKNIDPTQGGGKLVAHYIDQDNVEAAKDMDFKAGTSEKDFMKKMADELNISQKTKNYFFENLYKERGGHIDFTPEELKGYQVGGRKGGVTAKMAFDDKIDNLNFESAFKEKGDDIATSISKELEGLGYTVEFSSRLTPWGSNEIIIKKKGEGQVAKVKLESSNPAQELRDALKGAVDSKKADELRKSGLLKSIRKTSPTPAAAETDYTQK